MEYVVNSAVIVRNWRVGEREHSTVAAVNRGKNAAE